MELREMAWVGQGSQSHSSPFSLDEITRYVETYGEPEARLNRSPNSTSVVFKMNRTRALGLMVAINSRNDSRDRWEAEYPRMRFMALTDPIGESFIIFVPNLPWYRKLRAIVMSAAHDGDPLEHSVVDALNLIHDLRSVTSLLNSVRGVKASLIMDAEGISREQMSTSILIDAGFEFILRLSNFLSDGFYSSKTGLLATFRPFVSDGNLVYALRMFSLNEQGKIPGVNFANSVSLFCAKLSEWVTHEWIKAKELELI